LIDYGFNYEILLEENLPYHLESQTKQNFTWMKKLDEKDYLYTLLLESG